MASLVVIVFAILFIFGFPVILSIALPAVIYILFNGIDISLVAHRLQYALNSFPLIAVPVFILAGNLMNTAGHTERIFRFANTLVGRLYGGLAQVNIVASLIFSGMSGAALADIGGLGQIEIKAMKERGFSAAFSAAITTASATVGPIFPPSVPVVIYAAVTGTSVVKLLLSGMLPAIAAVIVMMVLTAVISKKKKYPRADRWPTASEVIKDFVPAFPALLAPALLIFGMISGYFTPTEAATVTVVYILFISTVIYRDFNLRNLFNAAIESARATAGILLIVSVASLFSWILAIEHVPALFNDFIFSFGNEPLVLLVIVNLIFLLVGMVLDSTTATLLVVPIVAPPVVAAGVNPVHLGIVIIFNLMVGLMTPPMGLSLYLISDIAGISIPRLLKAVYPYFFALLLVLGFITYVPEFSLWIPGLLEK